MSQELLSVQGLTKRYGAHEALHGVSFTAQAGEIIGLVGCNGAGKSTLMNVLTGYIAATAGTAALAGVSVAESPEKYKARIGYLPELPPLYPDMTVAEYLRFAAQIKGVPAKDVRAQCRRVMDSTHLTDHAPRLIKHLSKGYKQRVGLAQALLGDPALVVLDEPGSGLDPVQLAELRDILRAVCPGRVVLISSHILQEIADVATRILMIDHGRVVAEGDLQTLLARSGASQRVRIPLREDAAAALEQDARFASVKRLPPEAPETLTLLITAPDGSDAAPLISDALQALRCPVLELTRDRDALEELFVRLASAPREGGDA